MHYSVKQIQPIKMTADSRQYATVDYPKLRSVLLVLLSLFIWRLPLQATFSLAVQNDEYTHILLILPVSIALIVFRPTSFPAMLSHFRSRVRASLRLH